jgi:hypothetical protein
VSTNTRQKKIQINFSISTVASLNAHRLMFTFAAARKTFMGLSAFWAATREKGRNSLWGLDKHSGFPYSEIQLGPY